METIKYKGHLITIRSSIFPIRPDEFFESGFLISNYKYLYVENGKITVEYVKNNYNDYKENYYIFPISIYDHSGIAIHLGECTGWDVTVAGYILMDREKVKNDADALKLANNLIELWNAYLSEDVYDIDCATCDYSITSEYFESNANKIVNEIKKLIDDSYKSIVVSKSEIDKLAKDLIKYSGYWEEINTILINEGASIKLKIY